VQLVLLVGEAAEVHDEHGLVLRWQAHAACELALAMPLLVLRRRRDTRACRRQAAGLALEVLCVQGTHLLTLGLQYKTRVAARCMHGSSIWEWKILIAL
jgi:hypothetical protein